MTPPGTVTRVAGVGGGGGGVSGWVGALKHLTATQRDQQLRAARTGAATRKVSTVKFGDDDDDDDGYHATFVIKVTNPGSSADGVTCLRLTR